VRLNLGLGKEEVGLTGRGYRFWRRYFSLSLAPLWPCETSEPQGVCVVDVPVRLSREVDLFPDTFGFLIYTIFYLGTKQDVREIGKDRKTRMTYRREDQSNGGIREGIEIFLVLNPVITLVAEPDLVRNLLDDTGLVYAFARLIITITRLYLQGYQDL
jgi:hypothetical protein